MTANSIRNQNNQEWKEDVKDQEIKLSVNKYCLIHIESYNVKEVILKIHMLYDNEYETYSYSF